MVWKRRATGILCLLFLALALSSVGLSGGAVQEATNGTVNVSTQDPGTVTVADELHDERGSVQVLVEFEDVDDPDTVGELKTHAAQSQADLQTFAAQTDGVTVERTFWITSVAVVTVDTETVGMETLARIDGVSRLLPSFEVETAATAAQTPTFAQTEGPTASTVNTTYGLAQIGVPEAWDTYDTRGEGVRIAVLDTGVDVTHPDIDLYTTNESDPTYPGGWAEFNDTGARLDTEPQDYGSHGTHVSGTVTGGNASGEYIGVAPNADLMHGAILTDCGPYGCTGSAAQILSGFEWAIENDADIISMSLGTQPGYYGLFIEPIQNAREAGVAMVAASGNSGKDTSISPGNVYEALSVGASSSTRSIAGFSSGETITTEDAWNESDDGKSYPELTADWPETYVVPDVAAPGVEIKSSVPGGYARYNGTSMATPHVTGAVALIQSATEKDYGPKLLDKALFETATKPDGWDESDQTRDTRYGYGIIDVPAAIEYLAGEVEVASASLARSAVLTNESVATGATLENNAGISKFATVELRVDGERVQRLTTLVSGSGTKAVTFEQAFEEAGEYTLTVDGTSAGTLTVEDPATFEVRNASLASNTTVVNEPVTITGTVENVGDRTGTFTGGLVVDGGTVETADISIAGGENATVTFERSFPDPGEYDVGVNETSAGNLSVEGIPVFEVQNATLSTDTVVINQSATVTATVANVGNKTGTFTGALETDGAPTETAAVTVAPGENETVTFDPRFESAGEYDLGVNGTSAGNLTVVEPVASTVRNVTVVPTTVTTGETVTTNVTVENTGTERGPVSVDLAVNGTLVAVGSLTLDPGTNGTVQFEQTFEAAGSYEIAVEGSVVETVVVETGASKYTDKSGDVSITGLRVAIDDFVAGDIGISVLRAVIDLFVSS